MRYLYVSFVHAPLADIQLRDTNLFLEVGRILLPLLTLVVSFYAVTSLLYGETKLKTIFITVSYSFLPYILITLLLLAVSQFVCLTEYVFYYAAPSIHVGLDRTAGFFQHHAPKRLFIEKNHRRFCPEFNRGRIDLGRLHYDHILVRPGVYIGSRK